MSLAGVRRELAAVAVGALIAAALVLAPAVAGAETAPARPASVAMPTPERAQPPSTPHLPRNFRGRGRWIVRDMGLTVPFWWRGRDGDFRMTAGGPNYPIWFTNLVWHNSLYTLTYKWPGVTDDSCSLIPGFFNRHILNQIFRNSRFVGREILQRNPRRYVNHWRVGWVWPLAPPGSFLRFPLALGDIYVDQDDSSVFWQVLQFGVQNLYDPELDEWMVMDTFHHQPGQVTLPGRCPPSPY